MRKSIVTVLAAATLLGGISIAAPATAQDATVHVSYADLDLTQPADLSTLKGRIEDAVKKVCNRVEPRIMSGQVAWEQCKAASLADAMEQLAAIAPAGNIALAASSKN
jgi:UrcA family protein